MRVARNTICSVLCLLASPCLAHEGAELNHHWESQAYRTEMLSQIAIMAVISLGVLLALWLGRRVSARRSGND